MRSKQLIKSIGIISLSMALILAVPCFAAAEKSVKKNKKATEKTEDKKSHHMEDVVVKAQKEGLNLDVPSTAGSRLGLTPLQTPASVDVIPREVFIDRDQHTVSEVVAWDAPGITIRDIPGSFGIGVTSRGFKDNYSITRQYDGIAMGLVSSTMTYPVDTWTAERIEVLRGPASVLYGQGVGSIGGAINVVPKEPQKKLATETLLSYGKYNTMRAAAGNTGPITDNLFYRVDFSYNQSDGWMKDDEGKWKNYTGRASVRWDPTENLSFILAHDHSYREPNTSYGIPMINGRIDESVSENNYNADNAGANFKDDWTTLKTDWKVSDNIKIRNMTYYLNSYRRADEIYNYDYNSDTGLIDRSDPSSVLMDVQQYGTRLDATFDFRIAGFANRFLVGAGYSHYFLDRKDDNPKTADKANSVDPWNPRKNPVRFVPDSELLTTYQIDLDSYGLFLEDRFQFNERWSLVVGLRYDYLDFQKRYGDFYQVAYGQDREDYSETYEGLSYQGGIVYQPVNNTSIYGRYAKGIEPDRAITFLEKGDEFCDGEEFEIGVKQSLWDGRFQWTFAAYNLTKSNMKSQDPNDRLKTIRIGKQASQGLELSLFFDLGYGVGLSANGTILSAEYEEFTYRNVNYNGKRPLGVPEQVANVFLNWAFYKGWDSRIGMHYVGDRYFDYANKLVAPDYFMFDAGLSYNFTKDLRISFNCYNLFDKYYVQATYYTDGQYIPGDPRTYSVSLYWRF